MTDMENNKNKEPIEPIRDTWSEENSHQEALEAQHKLRQLEEQVAVLKDHSLRALADTENARKRHEKELEDLKKFAVSNFSKDLMLSAAITVTGTQYLNFVGRGGTQTITSAGVPFTQILTAQNIGGTVQHADAFVTTQGISVQYGTYASNYNLTCLNFSSPATTTRAITFGGNVISLTGTGLVWNFSAITGLTFNAGTSTISLTDNSATARTFFGGPSSGTGLTYWNLQSAGTTGGSALTLIGNNTFNNISSTKTVAHSILFTAGSTTSFRNWTVSGSVAGLVTISSPTAAFHNLVKLGASDVIAEYLNISYSHAS